MFLVLLVEYKHAVYIRKLEKAFPKEMLLIFGFHFNTSFLLL